MPGLPLVSVICTCYNHDEYVIESLNSVLGQTYNNIEIIIVNNGSQDNSSNIIKTWIGEQDIIFIDISNRLKLTKAFNLGLDKAQGQYIVDLSADDLLTPKSIEKRLRRFKDSEFSRLAVVFCNVEKIDKHGQHISYLYEVNKNGEALKKPPEGDIYRDLIHSFFMSATSMLIKKEVFDELNGYDEHLDYEDFDFWVRSSRNYQYAYLDEILVKKRVLDNSLSSNFKRFDGQNLDTSTLKVCVKAYHLNKDIDEDLALADRIKYHLRWALKKNSWGLSLKYLKLLIKLKMRISRR